MTSTAWVCGLWEETGVTGVKLHTESPGSTHKGIEPDPDPGTSYCEMDEFAPLCHLQNKTQHLHKRALVCMFI